MVNFGYPYNDIVICKDSTDYLHISKHIRQRILLINEPEPEPEPEPEDQLNQLKYPEVSKILIYKLY